MDKNAEDVDKRYEWLHSKHSSAAGDIFGEPERTARIGDEYQAQIPFLKEQLTDLPTAQDEAQNRFRFGLQIPVVWIQNQHKKKTSAKANRSGICDTLVPGSRSDAWSAIEHDSFLLGLYIFGKNLRVVNKFVGNKGMRNVVSYYYGKFYRSGQHQKWSTFRKKRSRKSVPGKKIFKGWRRHELLSRILPNVSDACKTTLTQVTRRFEEEKISFEKYVLSVRDAVGMSLLVEAIAIGKGKRDLTGRAKKSTKNKKVNNSACSSLRADEIINVLKEEMGLGKERLNEIFWEAVWPRLLARGWHSEQPRNYTLQNSNHSLVFLAPGVTKFSRRSLHKGSQYFDSVAELVNKVASEPWLLEQQPAQERVAAAEVGPQDLMKYTIVDTSLVGVVKVRELSSFPAPQQSSPSVSGETGTDEDVVHSQHVCKPVTKLKLICKPKPSNPCNDNIICEGMEEEEEEDPGCKKKRAGIVIDLNSPRVGPGELMLNGGQRQSRRNRPLSTKALEALANGFLNPKKKRRGSEEDGARRRVRAKTALVSSCGARFIENTVFNAASRILPQSPK